MKHISSRGPYLSSRKVLTNPATPSTSEMTLIFLSGSVQLFVFILLFIVSIPISFLWRGQLWGIFLLFFCSFPAQFELKRIWPGKRHCVWALPSTHCWGRRAASCIYTRMIDTSQTLLLALIGCIEPGAMVSCKSNYSHWVEPQTVDFSFFFINTHSVIMPVGLTSSLGNKNALLH